MLIDPDPYLPDKHQMREAFERAASEYDTAAVLQREIADHMLERLDLVKLKPETILDAGCGTGYCSRDLAKRYRRARILGLDIASSMVRRARSKAGWFSKSRFVCGDTEALPFATGSIDLVVSNLTLQWCRPEVVFAEYLRVLRPGGLLMFTSFGPDTLKELRQAWHDVDDRPHVHAFIDMHDLGDTLMRTGFTNPVMDIERFTLTYKDVTCMMRDLKQLGAHNVARGRSRGLMGKARFARFRQAYESLTHAGRIPATYEAVYGHAWAPPVRREQEPSDSGSATFPVSQLRRRTS